MKSIYLARPSARSIERASAFLHLALVSVNGFSGEVWNLALEFDRAEDAARKRLMRRLDNCGAFQHGL